MKTSVALIILTYCGYVVCINNRNYRNSVRKRWNPLISIDIDVRPVVRGYNPDEAVSDVADDYEDATPSPTSLHSDLQERLDEIYVKKLLIQALSEMSNIPSTLHHRESVEGDVIKGDSEWLRNAVMEAQLALGVKSSSTVPPETVKRNKSGLIGSVSSNIEGHEDNLSRANITSSPVNNSPISKIKVLGSNSRAKIGSATSDVSLDGETDDNTNIESSPVNNSPVSDSEFKNSDAAVSSATSNVILSKSSLKGVNIKSKPVNNSPITGSTFGDSK